MLNTDSIDPQKQKAQDLIQKGRFGAAAKLLKKLCKANPYDDGAWLMFGDLVGQQGKFREAVKYFEKAVNARSGNDQAHFMLGFSLQHIGRHDEAIKAYQAAIQVNPYNTDARYNLSSSLLLLDRYEEALKVCLDSLEIATDDVFLLVNTGKSYFGLNDLVNAESYFRKVLGVEPGNYDALTAMAGVMDRKSDLDVAIEYYKKALAVQPDLPQSHSNLALALFDSHRLDESIRHSKEAIRIDSTYTPAQLNLGLASHEKGLLKDAEQAFQRVIELEPANVGALNNLAKLADDMGEVEMAVQYYERALVLETDVIGFEHESVRRALSYIQLRTKRFDQGWKNYAYRKEAALKSSNEIDVKQLQGKTVLVYGEQGLGDELFFLRFAKQLKGLGARILYRPNPKITSILSRVDSIDVLVETNDLPDADVQLAVGDLPLLLGMQTVADIPTPLQLTPLPDRVAKITSMLSEAGPPPYIGVTWQGGTKDSRSVLFKNISEGALGNLLGPVEGTILILQRLPEQTAIKQFTESLARKAHDFSAFNEDLEDMLALLSVLDMYIGVSNTNMHLCAGINKPCHVLIPYPPEWRWVDSGDSSPWYPGFHVYRQSKDGDWNKVLQNLADDINDEDV